MKLRVIPSLLIATIIVITVASSLFVYSKGYFGKSINSNSQTKVEQSAVDPDELSYSELVSSITPTSVNKETAKIELPTKFPTIITPIAKPVTVSDQALAPVLTQIQTDQPVIFLGVDDGDIKSPEALAFFESRKWPVSLFINQIHYGKNPGYFKSIVATGATIENHTNTHPNLLKLGFEQQKKEICESQKTHQDTFGATPKLFRPPFGNYNKDTQRAVKECGMIALINWKARVDEGKVWYQNGDKLNRGEIVLMHFRPQIMGDLEAFEREITKQGLQLGRLEDWIK